MTVVAFFGQRPVAVTIRPELTLGGPSGSSEEDVQRALAEQAQLHQAVLAELNATHATVLAALAAEAHARAVQAVTRSVERAAPKIIIQ